MTIRRSVIKLYSSFERASGEGAGRAYRASRDLVRKPPARIRFAALFPDFLHVIADRQNLSAGLIRDRQVGNQTGLEGLFPDIRLGRQAFANLLVAIEKRVRHGPLRNQ